MEILTSPKAKTALQVIQIADRYLGPIAAQSWMLRGNRLLIDAESGEERSPVQFIRLGRLDELKRAVRALACEYGVFSSYEELAALAPIVRELQPAKMGRKGGAIPKKNSRGASPQEESNPAARTRHDGIERPKAKKPAAKLDLANDPIWV